MKTVVIGSAHLDAVAHATDFQSRDPIGYARFSAGGTAFNVAVWLAHHGLAPYLFTYLRRDSYLADAILDVIVRSGVKTRYVFRENLVCGRSMEDSAFVAHIDDVKHSLVAAISAIRVGDLELADNVREGKRLTNAIASAHVCVADCNLSPGTIAFICRTAKKAGKSVVVAGVSARKLRRYVDLRLEPACRADLLCVNHEELASLFDVGKHADLIAKFSGTSLSDAEAEQIIQRVCARRATVSNENGFFIIAPGKGAAFFKAPDIAKESIVSTSGAGDALIAGLVAAYVRAKLKDRALDFGAWHPEARAIEMANDGIARCLTIPGATPTCSLALSEAEVLQNAPVLKRTWLRICAKVEEIIQDKLVEYAVLIGVGAVIPVVWSWLWDRVVALWQTIP